MMVIDLFSKLLEVLISHLSIKFVFDCSFSSSNLQRILYLVDHSIIVQIIVCVISFRVGFLIEIWDEKILIVIVIVNSFFERKGSDWFKINIFIFFHCKGIIILLAVSSISGICLVVNELAVSINEVVIHHLSIEIVFKYKVLIRGGWRLLFLVDDLIFLNQELSSIVYFIFQVWHLIINLVHIDESRLLWVGFIVVILILYLTISWGLHFFFHLKWLIFILDLCLNFFH